MVRRLLSEVAPPFQRRALASGPCGPLIRCGACRPAHLWSGQLAYWLIGWCEAFPETIGKERGRAGPRTRRNTSSAARLRWPIPWKEVSEEAVNVRRLCDPLPLRVDLTGARQVEGKCGLAGRAPASGRQHAIRIGFEKAIRLHR